MSNRLGPQAHLRGGGGGSEPFCFKLPEFTLGKEAPEHLFVGAPARAREVYKASGFEKTWTWKYALHLALGNWSLVPVLSLPPWVT
jgi:hypothetical protein